MPIGGAENKENDRHILERLLRVSGGAGANIVVIPTASRMNETGPRYEKLFSELGAEHVTVMDFDTRRDCHEAGRLRRLEEATGIFITGGNQLRLTHCSGRAPAMCWRCPCIPRPHALRQWPCWRPRARSSMAAVYNLSDMRPISAPSPTLHAPDSAAASHPVCGERRH